MTEILASYTAHRVLVAGLSFVAALIGARWLSSEQYSALVTTAFLAKFLQILNIGAIAGYFVSRYTNAEAQIRLNADLEPWFLIYFMAQLIFLGLLFLGIASFWLPEHVSGGLAFIFLIPIFIVEPSLRYRRFFSFSLTPELILSLALLGVAASVTLDVLPKSATEFYLGLVAFLSVFVLALVIFRYGLNVSIPKRSRFDLGSYGHILALGCPVFLGSAFFIVASSADRLLLPLYGTDENIGRYFLAYQLCMGAMIFLTAINFVNTVNLGEARQDPEGVNRGVIVQKLRMAVFVAIGSYLVLGISGTILEAFFLPPSFDGLSMIVWILGLGLSVFYISNAVTPLVAYFRRQLPLTVAMASVAIALLLNNAFVYFQGLQPLWLASGTALAFISYGVFAIWFIFKILAEKSAESS